jgi:hypothetical protein
MSNPFSFLAFWSFDAIVILFVEMQMLLNHIPSEKKHQFVSAFPEQ